MSAQPKYRPSLTLSQMQRICDLTLNLSNPEPIDASIRSVLKPLIYKASEGIVQPAFVTVPKASLAQSLGFESNKSAEDAGLALWNLYSSGTKLSEKQILDALGYAFTNDLLTPEQESRYTQMLLNAENGS